MTRELAHRGPDGEGYWVSKNELQYLGHRRLSIIELSEKGSQPMKSQNGRYVITFNGEIYNHLEIREIISKKNNYKWYSNSDTETLLSSFETFGFTQTLKIIEGMFAFGLIDLFSNKLYLARDLNGEKPLYYGFQENGFVFSSELKSIIKFPKFKKELDKKSIKYFLDYSFIPEPYSIFKDIFKLEKKSFLEFDLTSHKINFIKQYIPIKNTEISKTEISKNPIDTINKILNRSVKLSMISDVEVGSFLSGGTDSSLITSIMSNLSKKKVQTFSVSIDKSNYNEHLYASRIAKFLNTNHNEIVVGETDLIEQTKKLPNMYDEPFADSSQIPTSLISNFAASKVKVILSGDGADEFFGGYNRYLGINKIMNFFKIIPFKLRSLIGNLLIKVPDYILNIIYLSLRKINNSNLEINQINEKVYKLSLILINCKKIDDVFLFILKNYFTGDELLVEHLSTKSLEDTLLALVERNRSPSENMMTIDQNFYLQNDILNKVDRASMFYSLETRMPFLNKDVIDFSKKLHLDLKIKKNNGKWILKQLLKKYVPEEFVNRPKMGFSIPIDLWLRTSLKSWTKDILNQRNLEDYQVLNKTKVEKILQEHFSEKKNFGTQLWNLIILQKWLNKYY